MIAWGSDLAAVARPRATRTVAEKVAAGSVCVMLPITGALAKKFPARDGDMPPHVTILFQEKVQPASLPSFKSAIARAAASIAPFEMSVGGLGHFHSDDQSIAYAEVRGDGVLGLRHAIELELQAEGIRADAHPDGFVPHATIAYLPPDSEWDGVVPDGTQVVKTVEVWASDGKESYTLSPVEKAGVGADVRIECVRKSETGDEQYILGVVLIPETTDSQGDIYSEDAVRAAAFDYMARFAAGAGRTGLQHRDRLYTEVELVESYVAPVAFTIGDRTIRKGTWLMGWRIVDADLWKKIRAGEYTGFSIGGTARKTPLNGGSRA